MTYLPSWKHRYPAWPLGQGHLWSATQLVARSLLPVGCSVSWPRGLPVCSQWPWVAEPLWRCGSWQDVLPSGLKWSDQCSNLSQVIQRGHERWPEIERWVVLGWHCVKWACSIMQSLHNSLPLTSSDRIWYEQWSVHLFECFRGYNPPNSVSEIHNQIFQHFQLNF